MKSVLASKPVLWFLFLFNAAVAITAGGFGNQLHFHGHTLHGSQQVMTAAGMGVVALFACASLYLRRAKQPDPDYPAARIAEPQPSARPAGR